MRRFLIPMTAAAVLVAARPSFAETRLGLGADYLTDHQGLFMLNLSVDTGLARSIAVGGRFGALLITGSTFGAPVDVFLRAYLGRVYLDGMVGPWFFFSGSDAVRLHGAIGFGLLARGMTFGLEVGGLSGGTALFGPRLAFRI